MENMIVYPAQMNEQAYGKLKVNVTSIIGFKPIPGAKVTVATMDKPDQPIVETTTDVVGSTEEIELPAPNPEYSMEPGTEQPYSEYVITVSAPGYESIVINGGEIFPNVIADQNAHMVPLEDALGEETELFVIPPHTLFGDYPPKIAENEVKDTSETGEIVLSNVVIPEYIVIHDGPPDDTSAKNYYVKYKDYIKNVASSEIYATWPEAAIMANVLAIQSFVLNRVYTEWYRNRGYNFTITNSTAYDQKFIPGRNIFENISAIVDEIFVNYLSRPDIVQPILTQYCDGKRVECPNWMSQWGSKYLADQGYSAIEILRYYYGDNMFINTSTEVSGVPSSWPGQNLTIGSRGEKVRTMQNQLNVVSRGYPLIPKIVEDGVFGEATAEAVRVFQRIFELPSTGVVDFSTWYKISEIFVAVSRMAELV